MHTNNLENGSLSEIRDPVSEIRDPVSKIRVRGTGIRDPVSETQKRATGMWDPVSVIRVETQHGEHEEHTVEVQIQTR